jgi:uncharacterized protein YbcV (DUF1398 family)
MRIDLVDKDMRLFQLDQEIMKRRQMIIDKSKQVKKKTKTNGFLETVKDDYSKYYDYILKEKQQQLIAMSMLDKYLKNLEGIDDLAGENLETLKTDQKQILTEMSKVKGELDKLVKEI